MKSQHFGPIESFAANAAAARFWFTAFVILLFFWFIDRQHIIESLKAAEKVAIVTESGTIYISPLMSFERADKLHAQVSASVVLAFYQRNPNGLDLPDLFEALFAGTAVEKAKELIKKDKDEFVEKQIHQTPKIHKIEILKQSENKVVTLVSGQLIRSGYFKDRKIAYDPWDFKMEIHLIKNANIAKAGRFPMSCFHFMYKQEETKITQ